SLAPIVALAAATVSATGLFVMRRRQSVAHWAMIAGSSVALLGLLAQALALAFAWPNAIFVTLIGVVIYASWSAAAVGFRTPVAHAWAIPGLAVAALALPHLIAADSASSELQWRALIAGENGLVLAGLSIVFALAADRMRSASVWRHGVIYAGGAAATMT